MPQGRLLGQKYKSKKVTSAEILNFPVELLNLRQRQLALQEILSLSYKSLCLLSLRRQSLGINNRKRTISSLRMNFTPPTQICLRFHVSNGVGIEEGRDGPRKMPDRHW